MRVALFLKDKQYADLLRAVERDPSTQSWAWWCEALESLELAKDAKGTIQPATIGVLVEIGDTPYIFKGLLSNIGFCEDGSPSHFVITRARRKPFNTTDTEFTRIPGKRIIVKAEDSRAINIDLWYVHADFVDLLGVVGSDPLSPVSVAGANEPSIDPSYDGE